VNEKGLVKSRIKVKVLIFQIDLFLTAYCNQSLNFRIYKMSKVYLLNKTQQYNFFILSFKLTGYFGVNKILRGKNLFYINFNFIL